MATKTPLGEKPKGDSTMNKMYYEEKREKATPEEIAGATQPQVGFEDLTKMEDMNEKTMLDNVRDRYNMDLMYTYCSAILVALNPFKFLPVYGQAWVAKYKGHRLGALHPHLFAIAEASYTTMADKHEDVSVIISGESGAGKTECTKLLLRFLAARMDKVSKTETMLLETVPILDVLGNAKTVRNDNSSRFGKYIEIIFDSNNFIAGSKITHYLLEKSRIVWQAESERNYHLFYQVTEGAQPEDRELTQAKKALDYRYLSVSGCVNIPKLNEVNDLISTKKALTLFDIDKESQNSIFKLVVAVLNIGNLAWKNNNQGASQLDGAKSEESLQIAADLLSLQKADLLAGVRTKRLIVRGETTIVELNAEKARDSADAIAKSLYALNFDWIIKRLNEALFADKYTSKNFIGVLDIFGFENFKFNSLEQLLINFANEKLQKFFNHHIFSMEQEEYEREHIDWKSITFKDNQECLDLIEKRPQGLLAYLDEECRFPKASDKTFLEKVNSSFDKHPHFVKLKIVRTTFKVNHYAGSVEYDVTGWLDKNKDEIPDHTIEMFQKCPNPLVAALYAPDPEMEKLKAEAEASGKKKTASNRLTVGTQFKNSLTLLTDKMMATAPFFVRCIKPNMQKTPNNFNDDDVNAQLKYAGMIETIRIRRLGYPIRYPFKEFYQRFKSLVHSQHHSTGDYEQRCVGMLPHLGFKIPDQLQKGLTKIFLKQETSYVLEDRRAVKLGEVILIAQSWYRMIAIRKHFAERRTAALTLETWFRARNNRRNFIEDRDAARKIQNTFRAAKAVTQKKGLLEKKRKEEEEIRRKKEEERQKRVAAGKITAQEAKAEAEKEAQMELEDLMDAVKKGKKKEKGNEEERLRLEREAADREAATAAPVLAEVDNTLYCPAVMKAALKWSSDKVVDLDLSCIVLDKGGYVLDACYYNQKETGEMALKLDQDERLGEKAGVDNETITIDFAKLTGFARFIGVVVSCYSDGYTISDTSNPTVELRDGSKNIFASAITETSAKSMDGKTGKHSAYIVAILAKSGEKWIITPQEKLTSGMRWMEVLPSVQKLLVDEKLISPIDGEKPFPKAFRSIKGEEIVITSNITKLLCGLGWVGNEDLDLASLMFRYKEFIDHIDPVRHNKSKDGAVFHKGDAKVGKGTDDEKMYVDLASISRRVNEIFFLVTVFNSGAGGGFAKVQNAHVRLVDATDFKLINEADREITRFVLSRTCGNRSAQIMCKLWRVGPSKWNVIAMGEPSSGTFYEHLIPKVQPFLDEAPPLRTYQVTIHSGKNLPADLLPYFRVRFDRDSQKTKQLKKPKQKFKEVLIVTGEANAMDVGIFHKKLGKEKFFGQIFVPAETDFKKKWFKLEDRGKKKEKVANGAELSISLENITGTPAALQAQNGGPTVLTEEKKEKKAK